MKELRSPVSIALEDLELQIFAEEIFSALELIVRGAVSSWVLCYLTDKEFFEHISESFNRAEKIVTT